MADRIDRSGENDRWGCLADLREALSQPVLEVIKSGQENDPHAEHAAYWLARSLGLCRLLGIEAKPCNGVLPFPVALAASRGLRTQIHENLNRVHNLSSRLETCDTDVEVHNLVSEPLASRVNIWAAYLAIDEADLEALQSGEPERALLVEEIDRVMESTDQLDQDLFEVRSLLSLITETSWLENWRNSLTEPYRDALPWWLDGTLEAEAQKAEQWLLDQMPSESAWKRLRDRLGPQSDPVPATISLEDWRGSPVPLAPYDPIAKLAAAEKQPVEELIPDCYWKSPDSRYRVRLSQPPIYKRETEPARLIFSRIDSWDPTIELNGEKVRFLGAESVIDETGRAFFRRDLLQEGIPRDVALRVGNDERFWIPFDLLPDA